MRPLTRREAWLLGICVASIFLVANGFLARTIVNNLRGSEGAVGELENRLADHELWLGDAEKADARELWLAEAMPATESFGKEQVDLLQAMQDDLFERKLEIQQQSLQDIERDPFFTEVAIRLTVRGDESEVIEWLTTLQDRDRFQVVKSLSLKIDEKAKEEEPQAVCQITLAKWFLPEAGANVVPGRDSSDASPGDASPSDEGPEVEAPGERTLNDGAADSPDPSGSEEGKPLTDSRPDAEDTSG